MKINKLFTLLLAGTILLGSCGKDDPIDDTPANTIIIENGGTLTGSYTQNVIVRGTNPTITLKGYTYFTSGTTLTIPAGTTIKSDITDKGALCIERGARIIAEGTATQPIVFTSGKAVGQRNPGDWGGILILGKARTNRSTEPTIEGGIGRPYGGTDDTDNSGVMKFVRIEFGGIVAQPGSEINGLTLGAVGSGTVLENIQVTYGNDDAFEFFGGTVNAKNLVSFSNADDDFDFDFGYTGRIQFGVALRDPDFVDSNDAGNGVECDNDGSGSNATPTTKPVLSNFTFVGSGVTTLGFHNFGNRWRRATNFVLNNSVMLNWAKGGFSMESDATVTSYNTGTSEFKNNIVHALVDPYRSGSTVLTAAQVRTKAESEGVTTASTAADVRLTSLTLTSPNLIPQTGSPALTGASFGASLPSSFFTATTYRGAFGTTNWMAGWTNFNFPKTTTGY
jgi:hypothetical protein